MARPVRRGWAWHGKDSFRVGGGYAIVKAWRGEAGQGQAGYGAAGQGKVKATESSRPPFLCA